MQLKKLKDIIKSIGTPNKDDTLLGVFNGKTAQKSIEDILKVTDYTALQNLPRTLCSGTLELTGIADGGYEASSATSVTYNGVEKFKLDKGNLLFLKDKVVNIQNGYGCYCIDDIPNKVDVDWTDYYGTTNVDIDNFRKDIAERYQAKIECRNGISIDKKRYKILSLQNGSTVLDKEDMSTAITASGRYDIAESGDMLIGFPGVTDFTPFTLKVNKGDIIKLLFDVDKNVTDVLYIGDASQNYSKTAISHAARKGYYKNPFFDITSFELSVNTDKKAYTDSTVGTCDNYINFSYDLTDALNALNNITSLSNGLIMATSQKDAFGNQLYRRVSLTPGLTMETSANGSRLRVVPMYLNVSESTIEYENEGTNSETIKDFAEGVYSYIDDLQAQIDELKKAVQPTNSEVSEN